MDATASPGKQTALESLATKFDEAVAVNERALIAALSDPDVQERKRCAAWIRKNVVPALALDLDPRSRASSERTIARLIVELRPPDGGLEKSDFRNAVFHLLRRDLRQASKREPRRLTPGLVIGIAGTGAAAAVVAMWAMGLVGQEAFNHGTPPTPVRNSPPFPHGAVLDRPLARPIPPVPPGFVRDPPARAGPGAASLLRPKPFRAGVQDVSIDLDLVAPLRIETAQGSNYFVKLVEVDSDITVMTMLVRGGRPLDVDCPLGTYRLRYASGQIWYGERELFGPDTVTAEAKADLTFEESLEGVSGYTIQLIRQIGGNLRTSLIPRETF